MFYEIESLESKVFTVQKDYQEKSIVITKLSEIERIPVAAMKVDLISKQVTYKTIGVREGKFKEPKNDDMLYFDYGYDLKFFYDEFTEFYRDLGFKELKFFPIDEQLSMPILKYIKLKLAHPSIDVLNKFYGFEVLLYSKQLLELPYVTLSTFFAEKDKTIYLDEMYRVGLDTMNTFRENKSRIFDYIIYAERLYTDANYSVENIDLMFHYLDKYGMLSDYSNFLKTVEALRYTNDINEILLFYSTVEKKGYDTSLIYEYLERYNKQNRKFRNEERKKISLLDDLKIDIADTDRFDTTIESKKLLLLFKNGDIPNFSKRVVHLENVLSKEIYAEVIYNFKIEFSKIVNI